MIFTGRIDLKFYLLFIPDVLFVIIIVLVYMVFPEISLTLLIAGTAAFMLIRTALIYLIGERIYHKRIRVIKNVLAEFKKGRFVVTNSGLNVKSELACLLDELLTIGRHFESIYSIQKNELDKLQEIYNNIIYSINSYVIIIDEDEKIVFANESFFNKFRIEMDEVSGKKIEDIFYFVNARIKGAISQVMKSDVSLVLENIHLITLKKISLISNIKMSYNYTDGRKQVIILIDDITSQLQKDYKLNLMSQISESIQSNVGIERVLHSILTGVTSGSGLGFNRAMLLLIDDITSQLQKDYKLNLMSQISESIQSNVGIERVLHSILTGVTAGSGLGFNRAMLLLRDAKGENLSGKMAVGPDSFEEAIDIWSSMTISDNILQDIERLENRCGRNYLDRVISASFRMDDGNIFSRALAENRSIHVKDTWSDETLDNSIREFLDVSEFVIVPLVAVNKPLGVIVADNKFNQTPIEKESIEMLNIFASQAALTIEGYSSLSEVREEMDKISKRQDAIIESEKLAAVGRIASHIAHEIRNPLVTMGGYARRIVQLSGEYSRKNEKIISAAEIILKESERLEKTLSNVMDFTRPSKFIREFNSINEVIEDTINLLRNLFNEKKIDVQLDLGDIPLVKLDFNQMKQVMLNLVQNSIDAMKSGGSIQISSTSNGTRIMVRISDTGSGIGEIETEKVFEPFYSTKVTGVGLGLAIVKRIINDHNGEIRVSNREYGGVVFEIELPVPA